MTHCDLDVPRKELRERGYLPRKGLRERGYLPRKELRERGYLPRKELRELDCLPRKGLQAWLAGTVVAASFACSGARPVPPTAQALPLASAPQAQAVNPEWPALPDGYDWSLKLGDSYKLTDRKLTAVSQEEVARSRAYFAACEQQVGKFPQQTFDCSEAQDMPVTGLKNHGDSAPRLAGEGAVPARLEDVASCDRPSLVYRDMRNIGCSSGSRIKRVSTERTDWVYVCRKGHGFFKDENLYSEIGLIGNNRATGETCFFAGRAAVSFELTSYERGTGANATAKVELAALTGQQMNAPSSDAGIANWSVPTVPGCTECHTHGPWLTFPFVDGKNSYAELSWRVDEAGDTQIDSIATPGYLDLDHKPVVPVRHPGMLYDPMYPSELPQIGKAVDYAWPKARRLKPDLEGATLCTSCHHIGNATYSRRYPRSVFYFQDPPKLDPNNPDRSRAELYLANLSASLRGSHNTRMLTSAWGDSATAQVPGFGIVGSDGRVIQDIRSADIYKHNASVDRAVETIEKCANSDQCWTDHWTLKRVEAEPLQYLQETCANCHNAKSKVLVHLTSKQEFMKGGNAWSRLNSQEHPHPPGGRLDSSVLAIIGAYLKK